MKEQITVGVLIGNANSPHTMDLMHGICHAAQKLQVNVLFFLGVHSQYYFRSCFGDVTEDHYDYQFNIVYDYALLGHTDALIISYGSLSIYLDDNDKTSFLKRFEGIPYVLVEDRDETGTGSSIISDNYHGMFAVVEHLIREHNYQSFTYLSGPLKNTDALERRAAFLDALEKYGIPFDESRIEYGDFSQCVEPQVNRLLDRFPDMDALVCANDFMADTAYRECARRGLVVGRDIAITGYDDWEQAESMNPPLTTVLQSAYDMGYMALSSALELVRGKKPQAFLVPAHMKRRSSCGCFNPRAADPGAGPFDNERILLDPEAAADVFLRKILLANTNQDIRLIVRQKLLLFLRNDFSRPENRGQILMRLRGILESGQVQYISYNALMRMCTDYFRARIKYVFAHAAKDCQTAVNTLLDLKDELQDVIFSYISKSSKEKYASFEQETWLLPLISRDMMNHIDSEENFFRSSMQKLSALKSRSSCLFIFEQPIRHRPNEPWKLPDRMYLAASQDGDVICSYPEDRRPVLTRENGLEAFCFAKRCCSMFVYCLFAGEMQYGILATEIPPSDLGLSYPISMQLGNALRFHELSLQQRATQQKLEQLVQEINEKNDVLNFIAEYDALTGCLNRRGFLERAVQFGKEHVGEQALVLLADLDHLKEINDCFGHLEGDFAIRRCAQAMLEAVHSSGIVGRIGGDEFAALLPCPGSDTADKIIARIRSLNEEFNRTSDKEYYIELSVGHHVFLCEDGLSFSRLLEQADRLMYSVKKERRQTIRKVPGRPCVN